MGRWGYVFNFILSSFYANITILQGGKSKSEGEPELPLTTIKTMTTSTGTSTTVCSRGGYGVAREASRGRQEGE